MVLFSSIFSMIIEKWEMKLMITTTTMKIIWFWEGRLRILTSVLPGTTLIYLQYLIWEIMLREGKMQNRPNCSSLKIQFAHQKYHHQYCLHIRHTTNNTEHTTQIQNSASQTPIPNTNLNYTTPIPIEILLLLPNTSSQIPNTFGQTHHPDTIQNIEYIIHIDMMLII